MGRRRKQKKFVKKNDVIQKQLVIADRTWAKLKYIDVTSPKLQLAFAGPNAFTSNKYVVNGLWDVNTIIGSTAVPGFSEYMNFYLNYRVRAAKIRCEFVNQGAEAIIVGVMIPPISNAAFPASWSNAMELMGNRYTKTKILSPTGGMDRGTLTVYADLSKMSGNRQEYESESDYAGKNGANPVVPAYGYVYALTPDGNLPAANIPIYLRVTITFFSEFYNRETLFA